MRDFQIPRGTQPQVTEAFRQVRQIIRDLQIPLLKDKVSLQGITDGGSALFMENGTLYRYTKVGRKLYREIVTDREQRQQTPQEAVAAAREPDIVYLSRLT